MIAAVSATHRENEHAVEREAQKRDLARIRTAEQRRLRRSSGSHGGALYPATTALQSQNKAERRKKTAELQQGS